MTSCSPNHLRHQLDAVNCAGYFPQSWDLGRFWAVPANDRPRVLKRAPSRLLVPDRDPAYVAAILNLLHSVDATQQAYLTARTNTDNAATGKIKQVRLPDITTPDGD